MKKTLLRPCPICNGKTGEVLHTQQFILPDEHILTNKFDVVCCTNCGFVFDDTADDQSKYNLFYELMSKYEDPSTASGGGDKIYDKERLEGTAKTIAATVKDRNLQIVDIGCGNGGLLLELKKMGFQNIVGFDPSQTCVKNMKEKGIEAFKGNIFEGNTTGQKFDLVIFSHVFEHICDLQKAIENACSFLKEEGALYVEIPDASRYKDFYFVPYHYFDIEHINHFDLDSLHNLLRAFGFKHIEKGSKLIAVSEDKYYPVIFSFFRKVKDNEGIQILPSFQNKQNIVEYIQLSQKNEGRTALLDDIIQANRPVYVWETGSYMQRLLKTGNLGKCNICAFVDSDSNKQGKKINGIIILKPNQLQELPNYPIIIVSALYCNEIANQIKEMGLSNQLVKIE